MAEVLLVEFAIGPITVNYEVTHGSLTSLLFHGNQAKVERNGAGLRPIFLPRTDLWVGCTSQFSCKGRDEGCVSELYSVADLPVSSSWNGTWNIWTGSVPMCIMWVIRCHLIRIL